MESGSSQRRSWPDGGHPRLPQREKAGRSGRNWESLGTGGDGRGTGRSIPTRTRSGSRVEVGILTHLDVGFGALPLDILKHPSLSDMSPLNKALRLHE